MSFLSQNGELLRAFREGQKPALEAVYRHYATAVARFLQKGFSLMSQGAHVGMLSLTTPYELENAVQETFVRAFNPRTRLAYDGLRPYTSFLFGIAKHVVLDEFRRRNGREVLGLEVVEPAADQDESTQPQPEDDLDQKRARELVTGFLQTGCNARDMRLYQLRYQKELSQEAAAKEAGLTRIQVRRWETSFRKRLLGHLKQAGYAA